VPRLIALVSTVVFVDTLLFGAIIPLVPGYADEFDLSKLQAGLLVGAYGAGALAGGIPAGLLARRIGPRAAVVVGLLALAVASVAFALAGGPLALGLSRFGQGVASVTTWSGALAWVVGATPKARRGQVLGTVFAFAVLGFIVGPMLGALAELVGIRASFGIVAGAVAVLALVAALEPVAPVEELVPGSVRRALSDPAFLTGLWLAALPALLFGVVDVLVPLSLDDRGWNAFAVAAVFLVAGLVETAINPAVGMISDRRGRFAPIRWALALAVVVALAFAVADAPLVIAALVVAASIAAGGFYTPGMALASDRAEEAQLAQGLAFGILNTAWAAGAMIGPALGGTLADALGDGAPYILVAALCAGTLLVVSNGSVRKASVA
jgi:DHA1 family tetracycline resistance protein-like MFS transporter